jgi:16S rRNA (guanine(966)-N(2))-methyltransferase RsmD
MKKMQLFKDVRINSGKYRGKTFWRADATITRPALNRSRTGIFNTLYSRFPNGFDTILDAFAGSGAIAIESISRGLARKSIMVDMSPTATQALQKNIDMLDSIDQENCKIFECDILKNIEQFTNVDLVFIDPPYAKTSELTNPLLAKISNGNFKTGTIIIIETDSKNIAQITIPDNIKQFDSRIYGRNMFLFLQKL